MRRVIRFVVRLYPARWRGRYGAEFGALLEDVNLGWRDLLDVLRGALKTQLAMGSASGMAAVFGVAGALLAGAVSFTMPDKYVSTADFRVGTTPGADQDAAMKKAGSVWQMALNRKWLTGIIQRQRLYESMRSRKPMDEVIERMRQDITISVKSANCFQVSFTYENAPQAQHANNDLMARVVEENLRVAESSPTATLLPRIEVRDLASLPRRPTSPNRAGVTALGLSGGLLVGGVVALARRGATVRL